MIYSDAWYPLGLHIMLLLLLWTFGFTNAVDGAVKTAKHGIPSNKVACEPDGSFGLPAWAMSMPIMSTFIIWALPQWNVWSG